jgi:hypothetical protein
LVSVDVYEQRHKNGIQSRRENVGRTSKKLLKRRNIT